MFEPSERWSPPLARRRGVFVDEVGDELVVYDSGRDAVWSLDFRLARLWRSCDGRAPNRDELIHRVQSDIDPAATPAVVRTALQRLTFAELLDPQGRSPTVRPAAAWRRVRGWPTTLLGTRPSRRYAPLPLELDWPVGERSATRKPRTEDQRAESAVDIAGRVLRVDAIATEIVSALNRDRVRSIVLKGPAIGRWLYDNRAPRPYGDVDLLVAPRDFARSEIVLKRLGFVSWFDGPAPEGQSMHADEWARGMGLRRVGVDLHRTFPGIGVGTDVLWSVVAAHTERLLIGEDDGELEIPGEPMRALIVALHAAHHGAGESKPMQDLSRAVDRVSPDVWTEAARIAGDLHALDGLLDGLALQREGREIVRNLGLGQPSRRSPAQPAAEPLARPTAEGFERLANAGGRRSKLSLSGGSFSRRPVSCVTGRHTRDSRSVVWQASRLPTAGVRSG